MNEINEQLKGISELVTRIDAKVLEISTKLDELIKALHEYDGNDEYGESSFEAFMDDEEATNKRMDIIGQNGNEGTHYVTNEEADEDAKSNNNPANKRVGENNVGRNKGKKKRNERNNVIPDFKHTPPPPKPKRKSAIVEHQKYPPHKH